VKIASATTEEPESFR